MDATISIQFNSTEVFCIEMTVVEV